MQPVGVGLASRAALPRQQSSLDQTPQQGGKPVSGKSLGRDVFKAALAQTSSPANMTASSRAALRGSGALGLALSWAATAATMSSRRRGSIGMARLSLAAPRPRATSGAGTSIPVARNRLLRNGPELGEALDCQVQSSPGPRPDVSGPPLWRVLAFLGFWVRQAPRSVAADRHRGSLRPCQRESRRSKRRLRRQAPIRLTCRPGPNGGCECVRRACPARTQAFPRTPGSLWRH